MAKIKVKQVYDMTVKPTTRLGDVAHICTVCNAGGDECYICNVGGELVIRRVIG